MWDKIRSKTKFIQQLFSHHFNLRKFEEDASEDPTFSTAEIVALATGDHRIMAYVELEAQIQLNQTLLAGFEREIDQIRFSRIDSRDDFCIPRLERAIQEAEQMIQQALPDIELAQANISDWTGKNFKVLIQGERFVQAKPAGDRLWEIAETMQERLVQRRAPAATLVVGEFAGFELSIEVKTGGTATFSTSTLLRRPHNRSARPYSLTLYRSSYYLAGRLTEQLQKIIDQHQDASQSIESCQSKLEQSRDRVQALTQKIEALRAIVLQQTLDKQALEEELGLNLSEDATEVIDFGEE